MRCWLAKDRRRGADARFRAGAPNKSALLGDSRTYCSGIMWQAERAPTRGSRHRTDEDGEVAQAPTS